MSRPAKTVRSILGETLGRLGLLVLIAGLTSAAMVRFAPGYGVDVRMLDPRLSQETRSSLHEPEESLVSFYGHYLWGLAHGDLGESVSFGAPISSLINARLGPTAKLVVLGLAGAWCGGLGAAILVTVSRSAWVGLLATCVSAVFLSLPSALLALLFLYVGGAASTVLALVLFPRVFRYAVPLLKEACQSPHVLAARARGVSEVHILTKHVLLVAAGPLIALAAVSVNLAFGASIPIEVISDEPGIGQLAWEAALSRDLPLLVNLTIFVTVLTVLSNSVADLVNCRLERGSQ